MKVIILSLFLMLGIVSQEVFPMDVEEVIKSNKESNTKEKYVMLSVADTLGLKIKDEIKEFRSTKAMEASFWRDGFVKKEIIIFAQYEKNVRERLGYNTWLYLNMVEHFNDTSLSLFDTVIKMSVSLNTIMYNMPSVIAVSNDNFTKGKIKTNMRFIRAIVNKVASLNQNDLGEGTVYSDILGNFVKFVQNNTASGDIAKICSNTHMFGFDHRMLQLTFQEMERVISTLNAFCGDQNFYKQKVEELSWCVEQFLLYCGSNDCDFTGVLYDILVKLTKGNMFVSF
ncbi:hypothetical protein FACS1894122_01370 [Alphaproteobacteria bacterium]|nr:hypothetical protein FACS1894122_01370 [Alphaproteobacteria bacterium]